MSLSLSDLLAREQQVALTSAVIARMQELGLVADEAAHETPSHVADRLLGTEGLDVDASGSLRRALVTKVSCSLVTMAAAATSMIKKSTPVVKNVGKAAAEGACMAGELVFEVGREAARKVNGSVAGPACPKCGSPTVIRRSKNTHQAFAACSSWSDTGCSFTSKVTFVDEH